MEAKAYPVGALVEELVFDLLSGASRDSEELDTIDWVGSTMPDFNVDRAYGFPFLDLAILPTGNVDVHIQYGVPTFPIAEPPVIAFTTESTVAVAGGAWGRIAGHRVTARFARITVTDTSLAANDGIYLVWFIRGA